MLAGFAMKVGGIFCMEKQADVCERQLDGVQESMRGALYGTCHLLVVGTGEILVNCLVIASCLHATVLKREDVLIARTDEIMQEIEQLRKQLDPMTEAGRFEVVGGSRALVTLPIPACESVLISGSTTLP